MAVTQQTRNQLRYALTSAHAADSVADAVDAGGGVITVDVRRRVQAALGSVGHGTRLCNTIAAGQALTPRDTRLLSVAMGSWTAALDITAQLA
jgi:hypothetical protein